MSFSRGRLSKAYRPPITNCRRNSDRLAGCERVLVSASEINGNFPRREGYVLSTASKSANTSSTSRSALPTVSTAMLICRSGSTPNWLE